MGKSKRQSVYKEIRARKQKAAKKEFEGILTTGNKILPEISFYDEYDDEVPYYDQYVSNSIDRQHSFVRRNPVTWKIPPVKNASADCEIPIVVEVDASVDVDAPLDKSSDKDTSDSSRSPELHGEPPSTPVVQSSKDDVPQDETTYDDEARENDSNKDSLDDNNEFSSDKNSSHESTPYHEDEHDVGKSDADENDSDEGDSDEDSSEVDLDEDSSEYDSDENIPMEIQKDISRGDKYVSTPASPDAGTSIVQLDQVDESPKTTPELSPTGSQLSDDWPVQDSEASENSTHDSPDPGMPSPKASADEWYPACHAELLQFEIPPFVVKRTGHIEGRQGAEVKRIPGMKAIYSLTLPVGDYKRILDLDEIMISTFSQRSFNSKTDYIFHKDGNASNHAIDNLHVCSLHELQRLEINLQQELHPGTNYAVADMGLWGPDFDHYLVSSDKTVYSLVNRTHLNTFEDEAGQQFVYLTAPNIDGQPTKHTVLMEELIQHSFKARASPNQNQQEHAGKHAHLLRTNSSTDSSRTGTDSDVYQDEPVTPKVYLSPKEDYLQKQSPNSLSPVNSIVHPLPRTRGNSGGSIIHFILNGEDLMRKQQEHDAGAPDLSNHRFGGHQGLDALRIRYQTTQSSYEPKGSDSYSKFKASREADDYDSSATPDKQNIDSFDHIHHVGNDTFEGPNTIVHRMPRSKEIFGWDDQDSVMRAIPEDYDTVVNDVTPDEPISKPTVPNTLESQNTTISNQQYPAAHATQEPPQKNLHIQQAALKQHNRPVLNNLPCTPPQEIPHNMQMNSTRVQHYTPHSAQKPVKEQPDVTKQRYHEPAESHPLTWQDIFNQQHTVPAQQPNVTKRSVQKTPSGKDRSHSAKVPYENQAAPEKQLRAAEHNVQGNRVTSKDGKGVVEHNIPKEQKLVPRETQDAPVQSTQEVQKVVSEEPQSSATSTTTDTNTTTEPLSTTEDEDIEEPRWLPIGTLPWNGQSFNGYEVSDSGHVRQIGTSTIIEAKVASTGHVVVRLESDSEPTGKRSTKTQVPVSRIVAKAFIEGYSEDRCYVKHRNRNPQDNSAQNLEWVDRKGLMVGKKRRTVVATCVDDPTAQKQFPSVRQAEIALVTTIRGIPPNGTIEKSVNWDGEDRLAVIQVLE